MSVDSHFIRCRFDNAVVDSMLAGSGLEQSTYVGCSFDGAKLVMSPGGHARFEDCSFEGTTITDWYAVNVELVRCRFTGVIKRSSLRGTVPEDRRSGAEREVNEIVDNDFSAARLIDVAFKTGIDLSAQKLPQADGCYVLLDAARDLSRARQILLDWPPSRGREVGERLVGIYEGEVARGQQQLWVRVDDFSVKDRPPLRTLFDAVTGR